MRVPTLQTERLTLTLPGSEAAAAYAAYLERNRAHFAPWVPRQPDGVYSETHCRLALLHAREEWAAGRSARFMFFRRGEEDGQIIGNASITEIIRGPLLGCFLGYKLDEAFQGQGLMSEALTAVIAWTFDELGLHRISANYRPTNERSGRVLRRLGFVVEGYSRDYLFIDGAWRDHILTALTNPSAHP